MSEVSNTKRWKITLTMDILEGSHPRKWFIETIAENLEIDENIIDYDFEEVEK